MEGQDVKSAVAVIDNGKFGKREIKFETGRLAKQAAGAAAVYLDDQTMIFSATTASKTPKDQFDFFPLTVDVEEKMYAIGKIPGSFFRREGRPSEEAILTCRLIDRPLRPSFIKGLRNEVQIVVTVMALDPDHMYDVIAINAASMSTQLAGLPFSGPIGGVRVALIDGQWVAFPNHSQVENAVFDMVVAGRVTADDVAIMMVEAEATTRTIGLLMLQSHLFVFSAKHSRSLQPLPQSQQLTSQCSLITRTMYSLQLKRQPRMTLQRRSQSQVNKSARQRSMRSLPQLRNLFLPPSKAVKKKFLQHSAHLQRSLYASAYFATRFVSMVADSAISVRSLQKLRSSLAFTVQQFSNVVRLRFSESQLLTCSRWNSSSTP
jgi:polyribonucleotide nucleotidyltransferase